MSRKKTVHLDPMSPTKTKTSVLVLNTIKTLLERGNGRVNVSDLEAALGSMRQARHAVWLARYSGIKLNAIRVGRKVESYVNTITVDSPQTKHIPNVHKPHWNNMTSMKIPKISQLATANT